MSELLEVFVLSYNRVEYLKECLISILNQTYKDFRIIVLDNASEQDVAGLVKSLNNDRVELIVNESNIGVAANFNKALDLARAKYVVIFHDDDCMHPKLIEAQLGLFKKEPNLSSVAANANFVRDSSLMSVFKNDIDSTVDMARSPLEFMSAGYGRGVAGFGSTMYRTDLVKKVKPDFEKFANIADRPFLFELTKHGPSARLIDSAYYNVRVHQGQGFALNYRPWSHLNEIEVARYYMDYVDGVDTKSFRNKIIKGLVQQYVVRAQRVCLNTWFKELESRGLLYKWQLFKYLPFYLFRDTMIRCFRVVAPNSYEQLAWRKLRIKSEKGISSQERIAQI